jgi:Protein of unknown function (DUF3142)
VVGATHLLFCAALLLGAQATPALPAAQIVDARDYDSFWLWAGVRPQPALAAAKRIYLLQGAVTLGEPMRLISLRPATPHVQGAQIWLVVRVETLAWAPGVYEALLRELARWRAAGNEVIGVQIDFDARTRYLDRYARFLQDLRRRLPPDCGLGVTGLLDWSANADPAGLDALEGTVDELVLQIYQGRSVIPGYAAYLKKLSRLTVPFRIGLLQGGEWQAPATLPLNPHFRGYVVFLRNP